MYAFMLFLWPGCMEGQTRQEYTPAACLMYVGYGLEVITTVMRVKVALAAV
jgi:hypothetical protein